MLDRLRLLQAWLDEHVAPHVPCFTARDVERRAQEAREQAFVAGYRYGVRYGRTLGREDVLARLRQVREERGLRLVEGGDA